LRARTQDRVDPSLDSSTWPRTNVAAAAPSASSCRRWDSVLMRGCSMRAMISAADASAVPGALEAAVSALTRSVLIYLIPNTSRHQLFEHRNRQRLQAFE